MNISNNMSITDLENVLQLIAFLPKHERYEYIDKINNIASRYNYSCPSIISDMMKGNFTINGTSMKTELDKISSTLNKIKSNIKNLPDGIKSIDFVKLTNNIGLDGSYDILRRINNSLSIENIFKIIDCEICTDNIFKDFLSTLMKYCDNILILSDIQKMYVNFQNPYDMEYNYCLCDTLKYLKYKYMTDTYFYKIFLSYKEHLIPQASILFINILLYNRNDGFIHTIKSLEKINTSWEDRFMIPIISYCDYNRLYPYLQKKYEKFSLKKPSFGTIDNNTITSHILTNLNSGILFSQSLTPELTSDDINMLASDIRKSVKLICCNDIVIHSCKKHDSDCLIFKNTSNGKLCIVELSDANKESLIARGEFIDICVLESHIPEIDDVEYTFSALTEGININKNGDVTINLSKKKSFMTQYAENHRELVNNIKSDNIEGAKANLALIFALISVIERDYVYNSKSHTSSKYDDAIKARMFLKNDFVTYVKIVQNSDKNFDFTKYYKDNNYDRLVMTIDGDTIEGIKKLLTRIMRL